MHGREVKVNENLFEEVFDGDWPDDSPTTDCFAKTFTDHYTMPEPIWEISPPCSTIIVPSYSSLVGTMSTDNTTKNDKPTEKRSLVVCSNSKKDLSESNILTTVARLKGKLMLNSLEYNKATMHIKCVMSSFTKNNLVRASKRLRMYGKNLPVIPSFDRFWNELPEIVTINGGEGVELVIKDPNEVGKFYLELIATPLDKEGN